MSDRSALEDSAVQTARWQRWQPSSFDKKAKGTNKGTNSTHLADEPASSKRAESIAAQIRKAQEALREQARAEGYEAGFAQGMQAGRDEGKKAGHQEGYKAGHAEGVAAGHAEGTDNVAQEAEKLASVARSSTQALENMEAEIGKALVTLSVQIAEHVLYSTLDAHPEKITDMVRQVLRMNGQTNHAALNLQINPADLDLVKQYLKAEPDTENWRLYANEKVQRGGCIAETALGSIDATLQTRWRRTLASLGCDTPIAASAPRQDSAGDDS